MHLAKQHTKTFLANFKACRGSNWPCYTSNSYVSTGFNAALAKNAFHSQAYIQFALAKGFTPHKLVVYVPQRYTGLTTPPLNLSNY